MLTDGVPDDRGSEKHVHLKVMLEKLMMEYEAIDVLCTGLLAL